MKEIMSVPMVTRSKARTVFDRSITGSYPARGMDMCPRFPALYYPV
jgi:hypothetical protein